MYSTKTETRPTIKKSKPEKEAIHSGHFMVSHFEAEAQDDEDELSVPLPEDPPNKVIEVIPPRQFSCEKKNDPRAKTSTQPLAIDTSLSKLFQCMSLAYRQKLTSPKWNRFRGIRLRWKDKIRLNNVIWRCWHLQFIKKQNTLICQFASPLDVDTHNKPEAVVLEGKYWKRKLEAVTAEYKKWRMYYRNQSLGNMKDTADMLNEMEFLAWNSQSTDNMHMMVDEDYMDLMSDTLFSTITNQPFVFPDSREIAKAGLADFIQPSLGPLQPNLDDYMDLEPLQDFVNSKLPTVPEEHTNDNLYKPNWNYTEYDFMGPQNVTLPNTSLQNSQVITQFPQMENSVPIMKVEVQENRQQQLQPSFSSDIIVPSPLENYDTLQQQTAIQYQSTVITKNMKVGKSTISSPGKINQIRQAIFEKPVDNAYGAYSMSTIVNNGLNSVENCVSGSNQQAGNLKNFKIPHQTTNTGESRSGYKFQHPMAPNLKFTSQKDDKSSSRSINTPHQGKPRSRSNTREPTKRPPLLSAVSDPALLPTSSSVLTQLLTSSNDNADMYVRNSITHSSDQLSSNVIIKEENTPITLIQQSTNTTPAGALILTPVQLTNEQLILGQISSASNSPALDVSQSLNSPTSSQSSIGSPNREGPRDQRRAGHIHAEQKRRCHIKNGFDMIQSLIPHLNQNPNAKLSKAAMLQKGAEYIRQLRSERNQLNKEMEELRQEIDSLNTSMSNFQSLLPATGAPVSRKRDSKMQERFDDYVRTRTMENWKFWILSLIFRPLLVSFNNLVSTSSLEELYRSTLHWIEQQCTLVDLRPIALNSLRQLCTKTDILSKPENFPDEARQAVMHNQNQNN